MKDIRSAEFYDVVSDAGKEWVIMSGLEKSIFNKISKHKALKDWDIKINYGIKTGYNEAFIIDEETKERLIKEDKKSAELIKPLVRGRDIKRYSYDFKKLYIIGTFPALKLNIDKYKAIKKYLESFGKRLEQSGEKGCRKKTGNKWFETQDNIAYYKDFEKSKIFWKAIGFNLGFTIAEKGVCVSAPSSFITSNCNEYLLGILSSSVTRYYIYKYSDKTGAGDVMLSIQSLEKIPIPEADSKSKNKIVKLVDKIIEFKKQGQDTSDLEREVDEIVYYLYGLSEDEIRVIEG